MSIANGRLSWAEWKPLGPQTEPKINPEVLIFHTIVGGLKAADGVFRSQGYTGDESTFGVGGPWDGSTLDGVVWQWQDTRRQADAQFAGNAYANSVETSDGGDPHRPWSSAQIKSLVQIGVDWFHAHPGRKVALVPSTGPIGGAGLGYHELRHDWNIDGHVCPGPVREGQLRQIVIPRIRQVVSGTTYVPPKPVPAPVHPTNTSTHLTVDGVFGTGTISAMQHVLKVAADGIFGPGTREALQRHLGVAPDEVIGRVTVQALQRHVGASVDGTWGNDTTRHIQMALNSGRF